MTGWRCREGACGESVELCRKARELTYFGVVQPIRAGFGRAQVEGGWRDDEGERAAVRRLWDVAARARDCARRPGL